MSSTSRFVGLGKQQHTLVKFIQFNMKHVAVKLNRSRNRLDLILLYLLLSAQIYNMCCNLKPIETYTSIILTYGGILFKVVYVS